MERKLPNSFCEASITVIPKPETSQENCRPLSLMKIGAKTLKIASKWNPAPYKKDYTPCQLGFIPGMQGWLNIQ